MSLKYPRFQLNIDNQVQGTWLLVFQGLSSGGAPQDLADMFAWLQAEADGKVAFEDLAGIFFCVKQHHLRKNHLRSSCDLICRNLCPPKFQKNMHLVK